MKGHGLRIRILAAACLASMGVLALAESALAEHLDRPESVLEHDGSFYVSLIGTFTESDGAIVQTDAKGKVVRTLVSSTDAAPLVDPKGMAVVGNTLWVADVRALRSYDLASGAPGSVIEPDKAINLNDVAVDRAGNLWVSDTSGDAFYRVSSTGKIRRFAVPSRFGSPNGVALHPETGELWFVTIPEEAGEAEVVRRTRSGYKLVATRKEFTSLDGITFDGATAFVTDVDTGELWRLAPGAEPVRVAKIDGAPADLLYSPTLRRLLIPLLDDGHVVRRRAA